jgi:hypothetical protein
VTSIVIQHTGAVVATPPVVGVCSDRAAERVALMAPYAAPWNGTGLPIAGITTPSIRLRDLKAAAGAAGFGTTGVASAAATVQHKSSTPGDQPPEDPLS